MNVEVDRIPALHLSLSDMVFDDHTGLHRWVRIVGLVHDGDDVVITCDGDDQAIRIAAGTLVAVCRPATGVHHGGDDAAIQDSMCACYSGDVDSASAAVAAHAQEAPRPVSDGLRPYPNSNYEGMYGGDLDHVVDAVGGTPDAQTRGLRDAATRRHLTEVRNGRALAGGARAGDDQEEPVEHLADWYVGDVGYLIDTRDIGGSGR